MKSTTEGGLYQMLSEFEDRILELSIRVRDGFDFSDQPTFEDKRVDAVTTVSASVLTAPDDLQERVEQMTDDQICDLMAIATIAVLFSWDIPPTIKTLQ